MQLIRTLFGLRSIYVKQTVERMLYIYVLVAVGVCLLVDIAVDNNLPYTTIYGLVAIAAYALLRSILRTFIVNRYVRRYSASLLSVPAATGTASTSIDIELNEVDRIHPIATFGDARVILAAFDFYGKSKDHEYLARQAFYVVCELPLRRVLPHIVFDSKRAKRSQFKYLYLRSQRFSVQGAFDDIFDTYVPDGYHIDSLSFVTPEVMQAMVEASRYDIEIINDKLLLYAPLIDEREIEGFAAHARAIAQHLNDNIDTYRDDRLTGKARKTSVTLFARTLLRNPLKFFVAAGGFGLVALTIIIIALVEYPEGAFDLIFNQLTLVIYIGLFANLMQALSIRRENEKLQASYRVILQGGTSGLNPYLKKRVMRSK
ncbi:hypothetical protein JNJ66_00230 [Candidatus Saccharibacteria bacterium]|nr:hypothetical protein [Candidatus Saccharibacteria bacterium]